MSTHELQEVCSGDTFSPIVGVKQPKERLFAPADLGPLILAVLCIVMCLFAGLLAYFLIQNAELQKSRETLSLRAATGTDLLQRQIANALGLVASLKTYMYLRDGDALAVDQRNEFDVFCNGRGSFPKEVFYFSYLAIIPDANATSWILAMRNKGSDYANFNMTFRDASNNVIPAPYAPEHYVAALVSR
jgi:CHASE1-domain containing sensor protein